ncbi:hypothetical protein FHX82_004197 [Amycolatopsis bartoniae]|uniref:Helix-hairpin-helix domain-containing protein n=1 Tax=Amycolatopsis bartoniae TaxID=941986 RepID=A0A8H9IZW8_9PSEU|nr:helix-hairpin-helix domain-containing protein [Amycolatopsis bartoniae]MBB2937133.1 hypothetical protein [Amycolatopsis bartoniae]TVT06006.1 helix-hairpin-helix domain-containing protein [Amycolatopsis bartoniae]GHF52667.1 hypothetical protein GCM10017566_27560 [Amycolatopsis bartoniae]
MTAPNPAPARRLTWWWYLPVTIFSAGLLGWVPFLHAAARLARPRLYLWALVYVVVAVLEVALPSAAGGFVVLAGVASACVLQVRLGKQPVRLPAPAPEVDPAVARVLAARARRQAARELAAKDPLLARELGIGRPDLGRDYDDGGLVDLNTAPPAVLARVCELTPEQAQAVVDARQEFGGRFLSVEDVFTAADLPLHTWDLVRERGLVLT